MRIQARHEARRRANAARCQSRQQQHHSQKPHRIGSRRTACVVVRDSNVGHQLAGVNSIWCPELQSRTTYHTLPATVLPSKVAAQLAFGALPTRRQDCHYADALSPSPLKHLLSRGEGECSRMAVSPTASAAPASMVTDGAVAHGDQAASPTTTPSSRSSAPPALTAGGGWRTRTRHAGPCCCCSWLLLSIAGSADRVTGSLRRVPPAIGNCRI